MIAKFIIVSAVLTCLASLVLTGLTEIQSIRTETRCRKAAMQVCNRCAGDILVLQAQPKEIEL